MKHSLVVGQKVIVTGRGNSHISYMDEYIGQVLTIRELYESRQQGHVFAFMHGGDGYAFDVDVLIPVTAKIR